MTPHIRDILIENVLATNVLSSAAFIVGLPEAPIDNVSIRNFSYALAPEERLLETRNTEPTEGHFHDDDRGIKVINARNVKIQ